MTDQEIITEKINQKSQIFITFDNYYNVNNYLSFLAAAKNNGVKYEEFLRIRPPHKRFIMIDPKDVPTFLDYDKATSSDMRWLISLVKPIRPNEAYYLQRREGQDISYFNYILPKPLQKMHEEDYVMVFKAWDMTELTQWSKKLGKSNIYKWGHADLKGFNIYVCFNPYINGFIPSDRVLLEYDNSGELSKKKVPNSPGEIEYNLNYSILVQEKLINKTYEINPKHEKIWRDVHHVFQWGITVRDLIETLGKLDFELVYHKFWGMFSYSDSFDDHAFIFKKKTT